jgi:hypothetical protein
MAGTETRYQTQVIRSLENVTQMLTANGNSQSEFVIGRSYQDSITSNAPKLQKLGAANSYHHDNVEDSHSVIRRR